MRKSLLFLICVAIAINVIVSCQHCYIHELPNKEQCAYYVGKIRIPNSMLFYYNGNYYICDSSIISQNDLIEGDLEKIISSPYVYLCIPRYFYGLPGADLMYDTIVVDGKKKAVLKKDLYKYYGYYNDLYCKYKDRYIINRRSMKKIEISRFEITPDFYNLVMMNIAYFEWSMGCYAYSGIKPIKSFSPSNRYVRVIYPICKKCNEIDTVAL